METYKLIDFISGNPENADEVLEWMASCDENRAEYFRIKEIVMAGKLSHYGSEMEVARAVSEIGAVIEGGGRFRRSRSIQHASLSLAASFAALMFLMGSYLYRENFKSETIENNTASVMTATLMDGSAAILNCGAKISYRKNFFHNGGRGVRLEEGEAYFQIRRDPVHPFTVTTPQTDIRVLGTRFNVNVTDATTVILESGSVALLDNHGETLATLSPGDRACVPDGGGLSLESNVNTAVSTQWRYARTVLDDCSLETIASYIENHYGKSVVYDSGKLSDIRFRIVISDDDSLEDILEMLGLITGTDCSVIEGKVYIK